MAKRYLITIDVGTSSTKTALWDDSGVVVAEATSAYSLHQPYPLWAEIDANFWWLSVCSTIREVISKGGAHPYDVAGIGIDAVGWTVVPVDRDSNPLAPAMIWLDRRAGEEAEWMRGLPNARRLVNLVANPIDPAYITPKLLWLKQNRPDIFDSAFQFLTASGFIVARFTGIFSCDYTQAYGYHFFDIGRQSWDNDIAKFLGIPIEKMPPLHACTKIVGEITEQAAAETGLIAGIPVIAGCLDAAAGALGAGVTKVGQTNEQGGQAGGFALSVDKIVVEPQLIFSHHVVRSQYLLQAGTVGGGSLGWFRDVFGQVEANAAALLDQNIFELFSAQADKVAPGANGLIFIPYMAGERTPLWSSSAGGVFFGLSYRTTRGDMLRAIMEGCAFAVYDNMKIAEQKGAVINECLGSGGATQSAVWCQIKADVYGKPFVVARRADGGEGGHSLGLYALTAFAANMQTDIGACVERLLPQRQIFEPSPTRHALYEELFQVYHRVSRKLLEDFDQLASVTQKYAQQEIQ